MLDIDVFSRCGVLFVRLFGRLTKDNYSKLNRDVLRLLNDVQVLNVVINIQNLFYIDHFGLKAIRRVYKMCDNSLLCVNPNQLNMVEDFNVVTCEESAISKINI